MREIRPSGSEGGEEFKPLSLPLSAGEDARRHEHLWGTRPACRMRRRPAASVRHPAVASAHGAACRARTPDPSAPVRVLCQGGVSPPPTGSLTGR